MSSATCNVCSRDNAAGALQCAACGAALERRCARCGNAAARDANFCQHCGFDLRTNASAAYTPKHLAEKILTSRAAIEGERKHVTVLFIDVKNSVELGRRVGPEEWHRLINRFFAILAESVHRFEGTVNQYTGDGIMALFGAPLSHEDHAQRACRAALDMRERLKPFCAEIRKKQRLRFAVRTGLNSGEVVVGKIGDDLRMDYTALGDTVGLASRMEQAAPPGAIFLSGETAALVADYFELADQGARKVKGVDRLVRVYTLEAAHRSRTRLEVGRVRGFQAFLGRSAELGALRQALDLARGGHAQVVGVAGVAGVGKSRLCQEFVDGCRAEGIATAEVHCPAHAQSFPFFSTMELLRALFGISLDDDRTAARQQVTQRLRRFGHAFREELPRVIALLDLAPSRGSAPIDASEGNTWLSPFVQRLVQSESARQPLVILIDDAHWLDRESDDALTKLVEAVGWTRTLLVVNFRREYRPRWAGVSYVREIELAPLATSTTDELLADLLGGDDDATATLRAQVRDRADGIPFFLEEILQALRQQNVLSWDTDDADHPRYRLRPGREVEGSISIPSTVQSLLAARIDRLGEGEKAVLQTAAVIGKRFTPVLLQQTLENLASLGADTAGAAVGDALTTLEGADFVHRGDGEEEYGFRHSLTQEVAYQAQLRDHRCRVHEAVAQALEAVYADRLGQQAPLIAHHWNAAEKRGQAGMWRYRAALQVTNIQVARGRAKKGS